MRTIAIYYVVIGHGMLLLEDTVAATLFNFIYIDGVELFFVLSGFLIGSILIRMAALGQTKPKQLLYFWVRRWFRTVPLYYIFLLLNLALGYFMVIETNISVFSAKFLVFLQNFNWYFYGFFNESWSLAVEEWFYLLFPFAFFGLSYFVKEKKAFYASAIIFILLSVAFRVYVGNHIENYFQWDFKIRKIVLTRLDAIMWGVVAARLCIDFPGQFVRYRYHTLVAGLLLYFAAKAIPGFPLGAYYTYVYLTLASLAIAMTLPFFFKLKTPNERIRQVFTFTSTISYSMYLVHGIVLGIVLNFLQPQPLWVSLLLFFGFLFVTCFLSWCSYHFFEKPAMKLRDHRFFVNMLMVKE
jgi:peptidoglycan/LPS O-acetylase OafA/YrhL